MKNVKTIITSCREKSSEKCFEFSWTDFKNLNRCKLLFFQGNNFSTTFPSAVTCVGIESLHLKVKSFDKKMTVSDVQTRNNDTMQMSCVIRRKLLHRNKYISCFDIFLTHELLLDLKYDKSL